MDNPIFDKEFTDAYKRDTFILWYNRQKPSAKRLQQLIPTDWGKPPAVTSIAIWINKYFKPQAEILDAQVAKELEQRMVAEKVEMLSRHAKLGQEMQDMALDYFENHPADLNPSTSVRLLVEGVRIERESRGLPQALEKMMDKSDEELLEEVKKLIGEGDAEIMAIPENE